MNYAERRRALEGGSAACKAQLNRIYIRDLGICQICGKECHRDEASRDHIGDMHECTTREQFNADSNVQLAHVTCNNMKHWAPKSKIRTIRPTRNHLSRTIAEEFPLEKWMSILTTESD